MRTLSRMDFDLERFVAAQDADGSYDTALAELWSGRKRTHWIWWVLPQLRGLGHSARSHAFGITGQAEAVAYLEHPVLGPRFRACTEAIASLETSDPTALLGGDDVKLHSCLTLFARASPEFVPLLVKYFGGAEDRATVALLDA